MSFLNKIFHRNKEDSEEREFDFGEEHEQESKEEFAAPEFNIHQDMGLGHGQAQQSFHQPSHGEDLLMSRLETINAKLDNVLHRLEKLEKIAERESKNEGW